MAPLLDQGCRHTAYFKNVLTKARVPIPVVQVYMFGRDATVQDAVLESEVPAQVSPPMSTTSTIAQKEPRTEFRESPSPEPKAGPGCVFVLLLGTLATLKEVILWAVTR